MASFLQTAYCKKCKRNVTTDLTGHCLRCGSTQINKTWTCRFRYVDETLKEVQKCLTGFDTKKKCQEAYEKFMATAKHYDKQKEPDNKDILFKDLCAEYLEYSRTRQKESSVVSTNYAVSKHISPTFDKYKVKDITPKIILDWQTSLSKYSYKYKSRLRTLLSPILSYAEKYYDIPNQLNKVDTFRNLDAKQEMLIWTPEEFYTFIEEVEDITYKTFYTVLYFSGARRGELQALSWEDIDFKNNAIKITKTINLKVKGKKWVITTPKNHTSVRIISMPQHIMDQLKEYKETIPNGEFVFGGDTPLSDTSIKRKKDIACEKSNIKKIRIHDFRHSHASLLLGSGVSVVAASKRLGHSSVKQTLDTYAHLMPKEADYVITVLDNIKGKEEITA